MRIDIYNHNINPVLQRKFAKLQNVEGIFHRADLGELYHWEKYEISITCPSLIWPWGYKIYKLNPSAPSGLDLYKETYKREISRAWNEWGKVLARQDNPCEAADAFAKALSVDSRYLDAIRNRAIAESRCHILQPVANASRNLTN